jgi:hypothetical protein
MSIPRESLFQHPASVDPQDGVPGDVPREFIVHTVTETGYYYIGVKRWSGFLPAWIQLQFFTSQPLDIYTSGSLGNPAESANLGVLAVGAAAWSTPESLQPTSSRGPTPDGRIKPDIVGVDQADSVTRGPNGFAGTSQASPHVAGLAALVIQAFPTYTPAEVTNYLKFFALPRGAVPNNNWGYGLAFLPSITVPSGPTMVLDRTALRFAGTSNGSILLAQTSSQVVRLTQNGSGTVTWTATSTQPWLKVSPTSGTGGEILTVSVVATGLPSAGTISGSINFAFNGAGNSPGPVSVTLTLLLNGTSVKPFGLVDTPADNATGVTGGMPITGWALDDIEVSDVFVCRAAVPGETAPVDGRCAGAAQIFVGTGVFIDGARPDVQAAFPAYPRSTRGGWGFMVLTNMLPDVAAGKPSGGNGTFVFHVYAMDREGHVTRIGTKTVMCDNAHSNKPFGAIDTPGQGEMVSGNPYVNFAWAVTQAGKLIPFDGSTMTVYVDGVAMGSPSYNHYRVDIATLFPGLANSDGAVGFKYIDTTTLTNGLHTIVWVVTDSGGMTDGIGSRYFTVSNGTAAPSATAAMSMTTPRVDGRAALEAVPLIQSVLGRRSWDPDAPWRWHGVGSTGRAVLRGEEIDRFELALGEHPGERYTGYLRVGNDLAALPVGSRLNEMTGRFTWSAGVGFIGHYDLVFIRWTGERAVARQEVRIIIAAKSSGHVGAQVVIDTPRMQQEVAQLFHLGGWAADLDAAAGTGIDTLHVWAYPVAGEPPTFLGVPTYGGARPDVAAVHGDQFRESGYGLTVQGLPPGAYDLAVFAWSNVGGGFVPAKLVRVMVQ